MPIEDIRLIFTPEQEIIIRSTAAFSNPVVWGFLAGSAKKWIRKEMPDAAIAKTERLAQEFFRLIIPHQPETRLAHNPEDGTHYILSEEINGYRSLPSFQEDHFLDGTYRGLGQVLLCAMFVQEIDLKLGNIGLNAQNQVTKIDGDWSFAAGRPPTPATCLFNISPASIADLPYPTDFYTFNWLDLSQQGIYYEESCIVSPEMTHNAGFRAEVNQAIQSICLLPDDSIDALVTAHEVSNYFGDLLKKRRDTLRSSALQNDSFLSYLNSPQARDDRTVFLETLTTFQTSGSYLAYKPIELAWQKAYLDHRDAANYLDNLGQLLQNIGTKLKIKEQYMLDAYIVSMKSNILDNIEQPIALAEIKKELEDMMHAQPLDAEKQIISRFLDNWATAHYNETKTSEPRKASKEWVPKPQKTNRSYFNRLKTSLGGLVKRDAPQKIECSDTKTPSKKS